MTAESIKPQYLTQSNKPLTKSKPRTKTYKPPTPRQEKILTLQSQHPNASGREIARLANTDHTYTIEVLKRYGLTNESIQGYKQHRADILSGLQHRLLSSITQQDIEKSPLGSRILAACQIYDKERIELGKSTNNTIVLHESVERINALRDKVNLFDEGEQD